MAKQKKPLGQRPHDPVVERFVRVDTDMAKAKANRKADVAVTKAIDGFKPSYILDWWLVVRQEYHDTLGWQYHDRQTPLQLSMNEDTWDDWHIARCDEALAELDKVEAMVNQLFVPIVTPADFTKPPWFKPDVPPKVAAQQKRERTPAQKAALKDIRKRSARRSKRAGDFSDEEWSK